MGVEAAAGGEMTTGKRIPSATAAPVDASGAAGQASIDSVRAWDGPTRLFHWSLVVLIAMAWVSRKYGDAGLVWHTWNGYAILILITFRILWGFVGGSTARFAAFVPEPITALVYGKDFLLRRPRYYLGHNPLGGAMVYALLLIIAAQAMIGLFSYDDHDSIAGGPLSGKLGEEWVAFLTKWHLRIFDYILILIGLHIFANVLYLVWKRENLVKAMITGRKPRQPYEDMAEATYGSAALAVVCLILAAAIVLGGIWMAGGRIL
jgi:cytochrome b